MSSRFAFDDQASSWMEALSQTPEVFRQRERTLQLLSLQPGEQALDIGTGPGFLLADMAEQVGARGAVSGLERSRTAWGACGPSGKKRPSCLDQTGRGVKPGTNLPLEISCSQVM